MTTPIFHITTEAEWSAARSTGSYTGSTRGRTLAEVGFVHCSRGDQWPRVRDGIYDDVTEPLVLLKVDPDRLDLPVVEEPGEPGSSETFPHVYGPLPVAAVTQVIALQGVSTGSTNGSSANGSGSGVSTGSTNGGSTNEGATSARDGFGPVFLRELFRNAFVLLVFLLCVMGLTRLGDLYRGDGYGALGGLALGIVVGAAVAVATHRWLQRTSTHE